MALERGTRLGPYQIESPNGAGAMGEVYQATDVGYSAPNSNALSRPPCPPHAHRPRHQDRQGGPTHTT